MRAGIAGPQGWQRGEGFFLTGTLLMLLSSMALPKIDKISVSDAKIRDWPTSKFTRFQEGPWNQLQNF